MTGFAGIKAVQPTFHVYAVGTSAAFYTIFGLGADVLLPARSR